LTRAIGTTPLVLGNCATSLLALIERGDVVIEALLVEVGVANGHLLTKVCVEPGGGVQSSGASSLLAVVLTTNLATKLTGALDGRQGPLLGLCVNVRGSVGLGIGKALLAGELAGKLKPGAGDSTSLSVGHDAGTTRSFGRPSAILDIGKLSPSLGIHPALVANLLKATQRSILSALCSRVSSQITVGRRPHVLGSEALQLSRVDIPGVIGGLCENLLKGILFVFGLAVSDEGSDEGANASAKFSKHVYSLSHQVIILDTHRPLPALFR
jgi:hypothetical protein